MSRDGIGVRCATATELPTVLSVLDAAMLETDLDAVRDRIGDGVLVAHAEDRVLGACVVDETVEPAVVEAIAVRPGRRDQGVGTALVEAAQERWGSLVAEFDETARPFYASLGFQIEPVGDGRYRGVRGGVE